MPALLPELIELVSDPTVKTSTLLRKAMVVARRLKQPEWATWIGYELQGYPDEIELPLYRQMRCELKARVPGRGLIPILFDNPQVANVYTWCRCGQPIGPLEEAVEPGKNLSFSFAADVAATMMQELQISMVPERVLGANQVRGLIEAVRDKRHAWMLDLVEAGIEGDEISPPPRELQQAQPLAPVTIHIGGDAHGFQFMQNSPGGQQQQTVTGQQNAAVLDALPPEPDTLKVQAASRKRKWSVIAAVVGSLLAVLEGAGGGVVTDLVLKWLATLSGN